MKALIGLLEENGEVSGLQVDSLALRPPEQGPAALLKPWSASTAQLRNLLAARHVRTLGAHSVVFGTDECGRLRFKGARVFGSEAGFYAEAAASGCELGALFGRGPGALEGAAAAWRILWPWPVGMRERAERALAQLERAAVEVAAAEAIFAASRDEPGRSGQASGAAARQVIAGVHGLCAANRSALPRDALESLGAARSDALQDRLLEALLRASERRQHIATTEQAIGEALRLSRSLADALRTRVGYGARASEEAAHWLPGGTRGEPGGNGAAPAVRGEEEARPAGALPAQRRAPA